MIVSAVEQNLRVMKVVTRAAGIGGVLADTVDSYHQMSRASRGDQEKKASKFLENVLAVISSCCSMVAFVLKKASSFSVLSQASDLTASVSSLSSGYDDYEQMRSLEERVENAEIKTRASYSKRYCLIGLAQKVMYVVAASLGLVFCSVVPLTLTLFLSWVGDFLSDSKKYYKLAHPELTFG